MNVPTWGEEEKRRRDATRGGGGGFRVRTHGDRTRRTMVLRWIVRTINLRARITPTCQATSTRTDRRDAEDDRDVGRRTCTTPAAKPAAPPRNARCDAFFMTSPNDSFVFSCAFFPFAAAERSPRTGIGARAATASARSDAAPPAADVMFANVGARRLIVNARRRVTTSVSVIVSRAVRGGGRARSDRGATARRARRRKGASEMFARGKRFF